MKNLILFKKLTLAIHKIFNDIPYVDFCVGMNNPCSLFQQKIKAEENKADRKKSIKKQNQIKAGREAQQDGENVKNYLSNKLSYKGNILDMSSQVHILLSSLQIPKEDVFFINSKSHSDGKIRCAKSDLKVTIKLNSNSVILHQISVKSTFATTQVAVHSVATFKTYLNNLGVTVPPEVCEFFDHFTNSNNKYENKPEFIFKDSERRERFTWEEINAFNPMLWIKVQDFFFTHAVVILNFLISIGGETNSANFATLLAFCNKKVDNLMIVDIQNLIAYLIKESTLNNSFCVLNKPTKNGITTISLFDGIIVLQMKGSGTGAGYHSLQFKINGTKIKKLRENNLI